MSSKWIAEQICTDICQQQNISLTVFRLFNIYGSGLKRGRLISDLLYNVLHNEDLGLNDPAPVRDYLYIEDFINLILSMLNLDKSPAGIFNVGSGKSYTNIEVAKTFQSIINSSLEINILSKPRRNDISICTVDNKKLVNHFNWEPKYNLDEGIQHIFKLVSIENPIS
jgi:nucleoside-diphosphate-sugar epimerase